MTMGRINSACGRFRLFAREQDTQPSRLIETGEHVLQLRTNSLPDSLACERLRYGMEHHAQSNQQRNKI